MPVFSDTAIQISGVTRFMSRVTIDCFMDAEFAEGPPRVQFAGEIEHPLRQRGRGRLGGFVVVGGHARPPGLSVSMPRRIAMRGQRRPWTRAVAARNSSARMGECYASPPPPAGWPMGAACGGPGSNHRRDSRERLTITIDGACFMKAGRFTPLTTPPMRVREKGLSAECARRCRLGSPNDWAPGLVPACDLNAADSSCSRNAARPGSPSTCRASRRPAAPPTFGGETPPGPGF